MALVLKGPNLFNPHHKALKFRANEAPTFIKTQSSSQFAYPSLKKWKSDYATSATHPPQPSGKGIINAAVQEQISVITDLGVSGVGGGFQFDRHKCLEAWRWKIRVGCKGAILQNKGNPLRGQRGEEESTIKI